MAIGFKSVGYAVASNRFDFNAAAVLNDCINCSSFGIWKKLLPSAEPFPAFVGHVILHCIHGQQGQDILIPIHGDFAVELTVVF